MLGDRKNEIGLCVWVWELRDKFLFKLFKCLFYFWETEHEWGRARERGRRRLWSRLQALSCQQSGAQTHELRGHDLSWSWMLNWPSHPFCSNETKCNIVCLVWSRLYTLLNKGIYIKHIRPCIKLFRESHKTVNIWGQEQGFRLGWEMRRETFISHFISFYCHLEFVLPYVYITFFKASTFFG